MRQIGLLLMVLSALPAGGQSLLINGSFEDENTCTEYHANCAPAGWESLNNMGGQARYGLDPSSNLPDGTHFLSLCMQPSGLAPRSYAETRLLCPLKAGKEYQLDLFVRPPPGSTFDHLDVLFSSQELHLISQPALVTTPSVRLLQKAATAPFVAQEWNELQVLYLARGDEQFVTFGNMDSIPAHPRKVQFCDIDFLTLVPVDSGLLCSAADQKMMANLLYAQHDRHRNVHVFADIQPPASIPDQKVVPAGITTLADTATYTLPDLSFGTDSSILLPSSLPLLDSLADLIKSGTYARIKMVGYTDNQGSQGHNLLLSISRARSVYDYLLLTRGVPKEQLTCYGMGDKHPVADNSTPEGRRKNRRVEIVLYRQ